VSEGVIPVDWGRAVWLRAQARPGSPTDDMKWDKRPAAASHDHSLVNSPAATSSKDASVSRKLAWVQPTTEAATAWAHHQPLPGRWAGSWPRASAGWHGLGLYTLQRRSRRGGGRDGAEDSHLVRKEVSALPHQCLGNLFSESDLQPQQYAVA
jgi:hypothetical protein